MGNRSRIPILKNRNKVHDFNEPYTVVLPSRMSYSIVFTLNMSRKECLQVEFTDVGSLPDSRKLSTGKDEDSTHTIRMTREFLEAHMEQYFVNDVLYLVGKGFRCVENLDAFCWITSLCLDDNALSSFAGLEELPCLTTLSLVNNRLTSLEGADRLTSLVSLDVSGNLITNIDHLRCLPHFTVLYISRNKLSASQDIFHLILCPHLECVDLSYNRLEGVSILKVVSCVDNLLVLRLEGNAVTRLPWYRNRVIASCRKLSFLDMEAIRRLERHKVEKWCNNTDDALTAPLGHRTPTKSLHAAKQDNGESGKLQVEKASSMRPPPRLLDSTINWGGARPKMRQPLRSIREDSVTRSIQGNGLYRKNSMKEPIQPRYMGNSPMREIDQGTRLPNGNSPVAKFVSSLWKGIKHRYSKTNIDRAVQ